MYPTISDLLKDLFGVNIPLPVQTFGFFVAIAFLLAAWFLQLELRRKEKQELLQSRVVKVLQGAPPTSAEIISGAVIWFILGFKLPIIILRYSDLVDDPPGLIFSKAGYLYTGIIAAGPAIGGLLGAKLFHILEYPGDFISDPIGSIFSGSGLTMYGGLIVGAITTIYYANKNGIAPRHIIDATAPSLMLAYGVGRIGCQLAGDGDWGIDNLNPKPDVLSFLPDWFWSFNYPHNVNNVGIPIPGCTGKHCMMLAQGVYPTPLYESIICISMFFILWMLRKKINVPGVLFSVYLILNGIERFFIELIRVNAEYHVAGVSFTQAQLIAVLLIASGVAGIFFFRSRKNIAA
jgi:phosphatidylglycerol---prolipoprotein diacylglyceryl transferase